MALRPNRIPVGDRFPSKYVVNRLQTDSSKHPMATSQAPQKKPNDPQRGTQKHGPKPTVRSDHSNPNLIPLGHEREDGELSVTNKSRQEDLDETDPNQDNTDEMSTKVRTNE